MPSVVTHHYFAKDILKKVNEKTRQTLENSFSIFLIFAQSFDNLFYYKLLTPWLGKKERTLGYEAQKMKVNLYFENIINEIEKNPNSDNLAYLYGSYCHYILDSTCHPFVIYQSGDEDQNKKYNGLHEKIEVNIDAQIYKKKTGKNLKDVQIANMLLPKEKFSEELKETLTHTFKNTFQIDNMGSVYEKSVAMGNFLLKFAVTDRTGIKKTLYKLRDFICNHKKYQYLSFHVTKLIPEYLNETKQPWIYPVDNTLVHNESFQELYEQALTKTLNLITLTEKYLKKQITKKELLAHVGNNSYVTGIDCNKNQTMKYFKF